MDFSFLQSGNVLQLTVITVIIVAAIAGVYLKTRNTSSSEEILTILYSELIIAFGKAIEFNKAEENGFESVKNFVIDEIYKFVQNTTTITEAQKKLLTRELLESILTPYIKSLWNYKLEEPAANMSQLAMLKAKPV